MSVYLETNRLVLRSLTKADSQGILKLDSNPEVLKYIGIKPIQKIGEAENTIKRIQQQYKDFGVGRLAIIQKETGEFMGWAGLKFEREIRREFDYYDLGYRLLPEFWGKGIGTEAALETLKYGFGILKLEQICAAAHIKNKASDRIITKVGLEFKEKFFFDGIECKWYSLDRTKWNQLNHLGSTQSS